MTIFLSIIFLSLLIIVHELGHFVVARWCGMKVHEFSVGFGTKIYSFMWRGTEFSLRLILFGGYVRIAGMSPDDEDVDENGSFLKSSLIKKLAMISAGPMANYLAAALLLAVIFATWGVRRNGVEVKKIEGTEIIQKAGLKSGDLILSVDGRPFPQIAPSPIEIISDKLFALKGKKVSLTILREGELKELTFPFGGEQLGIEIGLGDLIWIEKIIGEKKLKSKPLQPGDLVVSWGEGEFFDIGKLRKALALSSKPLKISIRRGKKLIKVTLSPDEAKELEKKISWKVKRGVVIKSVTAGSIAQAAGLKAGDFLHKIGNTLLEVKKVLPLKEQFSQMIGECWKREITVEILRNSKPKKLQLKGSKPEDCRADGLKLSPPSWITVMAVISGSTAEKVGLKPGDKIIAVNGIPTLELSTLLEEIRSRLYRPITLTVLRNDIPLTIKAPIASFKGKNLDWKLGFRPHPDAAKQRLGLIASINKGFAQTWEMNNRIFQGLKRIITGEEAANLTGPVGIVKFAKNSMEQGLKFFIFFLALISVHLAFFNLLPIPALDGGRIISSIVIEIVSALGFNREKSYRIEVIVNTIAFLLMLLLLIFVTFKDIFM